MAQSSYRTPRRILNEALSWAKAFHRELLLALAYLAAIFGVLPALSNSRVFVNIFFLIIACLAVSLVFFWPENRSLLSRFLLGGLTICLVLNFFIQRTGGLTSPLWPGYFIILPAIAFRPKKITMAGGLLGSILFLELSNLMLASSFKPDRANTVFLLGYGMALSISTLVIGWLSYRKFHWAATIHSEYEKLKDDARNLVELNLDGNGKKAAILSQESRTSHWVGAALQLDEWLESVLSLALVALGADRCGLFLLDQSCEMLVPRKVFPESDAAPPPAKVPLSGDLMGGVVATSAPLILGGLNPESKRVSYLGGEHPIRSLAATPVTSLGVVIGVLVASSDMNDAFKGKKEILTGFAGQLGIILLDCQQDARQEEEGRKHQAMSFVSNALSSSLQEKDILDTLLEKTSAMMDYQIGAFFLVGDNDQVTLRVARGLHQEVLGKSYSINKCLLKHVVSNRYPLLFDDLGEGKKKNTPVVSGLDIKCRSLIAVPAIMDDKATGIFLAADPQPARFDSMHLDMLGVLANQVAVLLSNAALHKKMEQMAITDGLTGLYNHRYFHESLDKAVARIKRHPEPLSLLILDLDYFKRINDNYGHPFGDIVLKEVAGLLLSLAREVDVVARYGGEEMAILLVNTDRRGADAMAERIMEGLRKKRFRTRNTYVSVTVSIGSATYPDNGVTPVDLVRSADEALYQSKETGRDRYTPASQTYRTQ